MLLNQQGIRVNLPKNLNSKDQPHVFAPLREVLEPEDKGHGKMFNLETRAKVKG